MKDMVYGVDNGVEILAMGKYYNYDYVILNLGGSHPTAYIRVPRAHKYFGKHYDNTSLAVHGGLTYSRDYVQEVDSAPDSWWLGWDYNHWNDYSGFMEDFMDDLAERKKWTTKEILEHIKGAVIELRSIK